MTWLNNAWVIGIGTSILSGLLVTWVARFFLAKKENREYQQKISSANREITYAIRPGISEGQIPTRDVIAALTNATARRHGVLAKELYAPPELMEELMKEVMDSSFLSSAKKAEYCVELARIRDEPDIIEAEYVGTESGDKGLLKDQKRNSGSVANVLGVIAAILGGLLSTFAVKDISLHLIIDAIEKMGIAVMGVLFFLALVKVVRRDLAGDFWGRKKINKSIKSDESLKE